MGSNVAFIQLSVASHTKKQNPREAQITYFSDGILYNNCYKSGHKML